MHELGGTDPHIQWELQMSAQPSSGLDIQGQRLLLFSTKVRFSPETQPIRETAIDKIVEQTLLLADDPITLKQIQANGGLCFLDGASAIPMNDVDAALKRLASRGRVVVDAESYSYHLVDTAKAELWHAEVIAEEKLNHIINKLFTGAPGKNKYSGPFLECLCRIFARLGEKYVRHLQGELAPQELYSQPDVFNIFREVAARFPAVDIKILEHAVQRVFNESDPAFVQLKWNLGQNYYVAKTLGLDPSGRLLSKEVFGNAILYLDTNVLLDCLEPRARHYENFQALTKGCTDLHSNLVACQISIDELRRVVAREREQIKKIADKIPEATQAKVKGVLFAAYRCAIKEGCEDLGNMFAAFEEPSTSLKSLYDVQIVDSKWFIEYAEDDSVQVLAEALQSAYNRPWKKKGKSAANHDALLLGWVQKERNEKGLNAWIVTLDYSLPDFHDKAVKGGNGHEPKPLAVTLDALVHWMSPMQIGDDSKFAEIFSEAIKHHLLPQDNFFDMRDFIVFSEMEWASKELPADEVEACIRHVKSAVPSANPTDPKDREKISREMVRFFADPGRKYKTVVQESERQLQAKDKAITDALSLAESHKQTADGLRADLTGERLRTQAFAKLGLTFLLFLAAEAGMIEILWYWGDGNSLLDKVLHGWLFLGAVALTMLGVTWFYLGETRLRALGWPFTVILQVGQQKDT
jgi:hypothetical protein